MAPLGIPGELAGARPNFRQLLEILDRLNGRSVGVAVSAFDGPPIAVFRGTLGEVEMTTVTEGEESRSVAFFPIDDGESLGLLGRVGLFLDQSDFHDALVSLGRLAIRLRDIVLSVEEFEELADELAQRIEKEGGQHD